MNNLSESQVKSRQKTLTTALLLSMWAPVTTGIAVIISNSTTQLADFIRRTIELLALFVAWLVFRYVQKGSHSSPAITIEKKAQLEKIAGLSVFVALVISGITMFIVTLSRLSAFEPGGNVYLGLVIAILGFIVNSWFWRRYARMTQENYNLVIDTQRLMYRAKVMVDFCVVIALAAVAISVSYARYVDLMGSAAVSIYLICSGIDTLKTTLQNVQSNSLQ